MNNHGLRALAFDFGRVLTLDPHPSAFSAVLSRIGIDPQAFQNAYGQPRHAYDRGTLSGREYWTQVLQRCRPGTSDAEADQWGPLLADADFESWAQPRLALHRIAQTALAAGTPMAVVSNMPRGVGGRFVETWPWLAEIPYRFFSGEFGLVKPDEDFYRHVLVQTGWDPRRVLFVDDLEPNIATAARLGFATLHFSGSEQDLRMIEAWPRGVS